MMKPASILVVDDEPFFRELYSDILSSDGYAVELAKSGEDALYQIRRGGIDIVLSDLILSGCSGLNLLREARKHNSPPDVILVTANATVESAIEAIKNGARDYLIKPVNTEELRHLVRTCLDQRQLMNENSQLKNQIRLYQKGQSLALLLDIDKLLPQAVEFLCQEAKDGRGFVFLISEGVPTRFFSESLPEETCQAMAESLLSRFQTLSGTSFLQMQDIPPERNWPAHIHSLCLIPLIYGRKLEGGIVVFNGGTSDGDSHLPYEQLNFLAQQAMLSFSNSYRFQGAQALIYTDDLTGLYNLRYLNMVLQQELLHTRRYGRSFALVFIDLDHFKRVNDTCGHLAGSQALKEVASLLKECVRKTDILFRYGGDEFTILLLETDGEGAELVSERIRRKIEKFLFLSDSVGYSNLTATIGYSIFPQDANHQQKLMELADQAMYHGKKVRNTVCSVTDYLKSKNKKTGTAS